MTGLLGHIGHYPAWDMSKITRLIRVEIEIGTDLDCNEWIEWFKRQDNRVDKTRWRRD